MMNGRNRLYFIIHHSYFIILKFVFLHLKTKSKAESCIKTKVCCEVKNSD
jgi:hypothetical protein